MRLHPCQIKALWQLTKRERLILRYPREIVPGTQMLPLPVTESPMSLSIIWAVMLIQRIMEKHGRMPIWAKMTSMNFQRKKIPILFYTQVKTITEEWKLCWSMVRNMCQRPCPCMVKTTKDSVRSTKIWTTNYRSTVFTPIPYFTAESEQSKILPGHPILLRIWRQP